MSKPGGEEDLRRMKRGNPTFGGTQLFTALRKTPKALPLVALRVGSHWEPEAKEMTAEMDNGVV